MLQAHGITNIPAFDDPPPSAAGRPEPQGLGHACRGAKIAGCRGWMQAHAPQRVTEGKVIRMVVTEEMLAEHLCRTCRKG